MGKLNFRGYLISRFYPICEIHENLMHAKNMCFTVLHALLHIRLYQLTIDNKQAVCINKVDKYNK